MARWAMATARKDFDPGTFDADADLLPLIDGLTLLALVGIVDPPRPQAKAAIKSSPRPRSSASIIFLSPGGAAGGSVARRRRAVERFTR